MRNLEAVELGQLSANEWRAAVQSKLRAHPLLGSYNLEFVRKYQARYSEVFEYRRRCQPEAPPILIKRRIGYETNEAAARAAAREFATLERLKKRSGSVLEGSVPASVALFPELGAMVMEKLPGTDLRVIFQREANRLTGYFRLKRMVRIGRLVGQWLRRFHEATREALRSHDSRVFLEEVKDWLGQCSRGGMESETAQEIWALTSQASHRADGWPAATAAKHGDFIPVNILLDGDSIAVLDFEDFRDCDVVYEDVGMLNAYLAFMKESPLYSRRAIDAMARAFVQGYGDLECEELLRLYTVKSALNLSACQFQQGWEDSGAAGKLHRHQTRLVKVVRTLLQ